MTFTDSHPLLTRPNADLPTLFQSIAFRENIRVLTLSILKENQIKSVDIIDWTCIDHVYIIYRR